MRARREEDQEEEDYIFKPAKSLHFQNDAGNHHWDFGYNGRNELTGGDRRTGTVAGEGTDFTRKGDFDYGYDPIGNRETGTTYADMDTTRYSTTYTTNTVNQYTVTSDPTESFTHDKDGNLDTDGLFKYGWDYRLACSYQDHCWLVSWPSDLRDK